MKVKVGKVKGRNGNQRGYGLVTGSIWNYEDKPINENVSTTLSAVPRDEANIEAEKGETVVFPDGLGSLSHAKIGGKRHHEGGTPLNIPDGSFVFSDTGALKIKNKDVLKNIFGITGNKPRTPAEIAKRYEIDSYMDTLRDPKAEPMDKKTAQLMVENNMKKLGQIALIQESMKGFPDGIPDIALPLFGSDIAQSQASQSESTAKRGGLVRAQVGLQKGKLTVPNVTSSYDYQQAAGVNLANKLYSEAIASGDPAKMLAAAEEIDKLDIPGLSTPIGTISEGLRTAAGVGATFLGDMFGFAPNEGYNFRSTEPYGATWQEKINDMRDILERKASQVNVQKNVKSQQLSNVEARKDYTNKLKKINEKISTILNNPGAYPANEVQNALSINEKINDPRFLGIPSPGRWGLPNPYEQGMSQSSGMILPELSINVNKAYETLFPGSNSVSSVKRATTTPAGTPMLLPEGNAPAQQKGSASGSQTTTGRSQEKSTGNSNPNLKVIDATPSADANWAPEDTTGTYLRRQKDGGSLSKYQNAGRFRQDVTESAIPATWDPEGKYKVIYAPRLGSFSTQHYDPSSGVYITTDKSGKKSNLDETDFINRQKSIISNYEGGLDKWKEDYKSKDPATRDKAVYYFQTEYDRKRKELGLPSYFFGQNAKESPYAADKKFGIYTYSAPGFEDQPVAATPAQPAVVADPTREKTAMANIDPVQYETGASNTPWWNYDTLNYYNQIANYAGIRPGSMPILQQYNPYLARPTFVDPARAINQQMGLTRGTQEAIMSGSTPTVGRANVIAAQAAAAPQIANIIAQYDQNNVGIANQFGQQNAQTMNQAQLQNLQFDKRYLDELEVRRQQYEDALTRGRTNAAKAAMQGMKNAAETSWINATEDSYAVDPESGTAYFKRGFDPTTGAYRSRETSPAELFKMYTSAPYNLSPELAVKMVTGTSGGRTSRSRRAQDEDEAQYGGAMFNPMDLIWNS